MSAQPWAEVEQRWTALQNLRSDLIVEANDALAASPGNEGKAAACLRARSDALFEVERRLDEAMEGEIK